MPLHRKEATPPSGAVAVPQDVNESIPQGAAFAALEQRALEMKVATSDVAISQEANEALSQCPAYAAWFQMPSVASWLQGKPEMDSVCPACNASRPVTVEDVKNKARNSFTA